MKPDATARTGGASGGLHSRGRYIAISQSAGNQAGIFDNNRNRHVTRSAPPNAHRPVPSSSLPGRKARIHVRTAVRAFYVLVLAVLVYSIHSLVSLAHRDNAGSPFTSRPVPAIRRPKVVFFMDYFNRGRLVTHRDAKPIQDTQTWKWRRKHNEDEKSSSDDNYGRGDTCKYRHEWQLASHPTCSPLHEINMQFDEDLTLINNGHYRDVFSYSQVFDRSKMVMKELRFEYDHEFDDESRLESHRRDAVAMGRLTNSKNIPNIYASCANAQIVDVSPDGDLEQHVLIEGEDYKNYTSVQKLAIAVQVAEAIADVHKAGISHTDVAPKQFLLLDGRYQLSDFNRCRFLKEDDDGKQCAFHIGGNPGKGRSPEEYRNGDLTPALDVYSMGNVYYYMLMGFKYFDGIKTKKAQKLVKKGERPPLSEEVENSKDPAIQHIVQGMRRAQAQEAKDRPSAREIAKYLAEALKSIAGTDKIEL